MSTVVMAPEWPCRVKRQHESSRRNTWGRDGHQVLTSGVFPITCGPGSPSCIPSLADPRMPPITCGRPPGTQEMEPTHSQRVVLTPSHEAPSCRLQGRDGFLVCTGHGVGQATRYRVTAAVHRGCGGTAPPWGRQAQSGISEKTPCRQPPHSARQVHALSHPAWAL